MFAFVSVNQLVSRTVGLSVGISVSQAVFLGGWVWVVGGGWVGGWLVGWWVGKWVRGWFSKLQQIILRIESIDIICGKSKVTYIIVDLGHDPLKTSSSSEYF